MKRWVPLVLLASCIDSVEDTVDVVPVDSTSLAEITTEVVDSDVVVDTTVEDTAVVDTAVADTFVVDETSVDTASSDVAAEVATPTDAATASDTAPGEVFAATCYTAPVAGHDAVSCGGVVFDVEVPAGCLVPGACGLIVDIHGWTMTADSEDLNTDLRSRAATAGYVVIQPTAPALVGVPTWDLTQHAEVIHTFVAEVQAVLGTDPDRSHAMGFSQGGALTWQLVCRHADFYASAAPIGALPGCAFTSDDAPSEEVDVLAVHGRNDSVVAFSQHESQRDAMLAYWPVANAQVIAEDQDHKATRWTTTSGTVLESWEHDYAASSLLLRGHCFPGSAHRDLFLQLTFGCEETGTFVYSDLALAFFAAHTR